MGLCNISDVNTYLKENFGTNPSAFGVDEEQLQYLINSVSAEIRKITNRNLTAKDYDGVFDMDGSELQLLDYPIQSVTTVEYGSPFGDTNRTEIDTDSYITYDSIGIIRLQLVLRKVEQYVRAVYRAGYKSVLVEGVETNTDLIYLNSVCVKQVVEDLQDTNVNLNQDNNLKSVKLGDATNTYFSSAEKSQTTRIDNLRNSLSGYIKRDVI